MTLSIGGENHDISRTMTDDIHVPIRSGTIYYCACKNGLKMLNLSDKSISDGINSIMSGVYYVATSSDKLYYTNFDTHTDNSCL
jgi:intracellular sulfur oxidation DsrE/DsrF family protein